MKRMQDLRKELGITSQGRVANANSVLFHLAFRLDQKTAEEFIIRAAYDETSESLWARKAILMRLHEKG